MFEERMMAYCLKFLENKTTFSRAELMETIQEKGKTISEASFKLELQKMLKEGTIVRVGRNKYCVSKNGVGIYDYEYSDDAKAVAEILKKKLHILILQ